MAGGLGGDVGDLGAVVARVGDEVLEDHLLKVTEAAVEVREGFERFDALVLGLADTDENSGREGDAQLTRGFNGRQALSRMLRGRSGVDRLH